MRTKLETFFLEELHRLLKLSMDEHDGWAQDRVYDILCRAHQLPNADQKSPMTETQKQAAAQSMSAALGAKWGQGQQKVGLGQQYGWPSPQLREAMSGSSNFKEYVLTDPTLGISVRITLSEGKK